MSWLASGAPFDAGLFDAVNEFAEDTGWLHPIATAIATYAVVCFGLLLVAGWWQARREGPRRVAAALWAGAGTLIAVGVNQPLVNAFHEARPYTSEPGIVVLGNRSSDPSFPSDHAVMAGAVAAGLILVSRRLAVVAAAAAVVLAADRVYVGVHYPHDVAAGLVLGCVVALVGWLAAATLLTWLVTRLRSTPLRPLVQAPLRSPIDS